MKIETILVPTDFSDCAKKAATLAADLARKLDARLILQHACELPPGVPATLKIDPGDHHRVAALEYTRRAAAEELRREAERLELRAPELRVDFGGVVHAILAAAADTGADLIVLGTHGRTGLMHLIMGSVAEKIVERSPVPVLTVRDPRVHEHEGLTDAEDHLLDETVG